MLVLLTDSWTLLLLRGVFAIVFGLMALTMPGPALMAVVLLFGAYALVDGIVALIAAFGGRGRKGAGGLFFEGCVRVAAGVIAFVFPGMTAIALLALVVAWSIVTGVLTMIGAYRLRAELTGEWRLYAAGALSVAFGVLLMANAATGLLAMIWLMGFYSMLFGGALVALALKLRHVAQEMVAVH